MRPIEEVIAAAKAYDRDLSSAIHASEGAIDAPAEAYLIADLLRHVEALRTATRNVVAPDTAETNREHGGYTFNAVVDPDYSGVLLTIAAMRLGDHAHLEMRSGRQVAAVANQFEGSRIVGGAGTLCLRWHEWLAIRSVLDVAAPFVLIREIEKPTPENLFVHLGAEGAGSALRLEEVKEQLGGALDVLRQTDEWLAEQGLHSQLVSEALARLDPERGMMRADNARRTT